MTLSSQSPRPGQSRRYMSSRRRRRLSPLRVVLALGLVALVLWGLSRIGGGETDGLQIDDVTAEAEAEAAPSARPLADAEVAPRSVPAPVRDVVRIDGPPPPRIQTLIRDTPVQPVPTPAPAPAEPQQLGSDNDAAAPVILPPRVNATAATPGSLDPGLRALRDGDVLEGRRRLSALMFGGAPPEPEAAAAIRAALDPLNARLVFSPDPVEGDTVTEAYRIQPGDTLGALGNRFSVPYALLEYVNQVDSRRLQAGQTVKLIRGPIHGRVDRRAFVMDLYVRDSEGQPIYLTHFPVGLGAAADDGREASQSGTPVGTYRVGNAKVVNPSWRNPRTGAFFAADNPENPIGEFWIPLIGVAGPAERATSIGIHGTTDPSSIGQLKSMGCIRLGDADIALLFSMLQSGASEVAVVD